MANIEISTLTRNNDGNTYIIKDANAIPKTGSNQISGDLIPSTDNSIDIGSSTNNIKALYTKGITINGTQFLPSDYIPKSGGAVLGHAFSRMVDDDYLAINGSSTADDGAFLRLHGENYSDTAYSGVVLIRAKDGSNMYDLTLKPNGTATWGNKNLAMQEDVIPRSGGAVMRGSLYAAVENNISCEFGFPWEKGSRVYTYSAANGAPSAGSIAFQMQTADRVRTMILYPSGTWIWDGTACQITSDQRLKQQIAEIDDKLLDAWEDVNLVQFKYNDAVKEKSDNARLHTGYVVQQIDEACQSHGVDISAYGLYCHEEYPQEVEEVEVEQADGTKVKERKVIREASEHYSLRYTECLVVECAYLRRCVARLTARIEELEKGNNSK